MALTINDTIVGPRRGDPEVYIATLDGPDEKDIAFSRQLWHWCGVAGLDYAGVEAWSDVETASKTADRWNRDKNPGGVGIPADSTVQPFVIADADEAARIMVQCLFSAVNRRLHPDVPVPPAARAWFDGVWLPKVTHPRFPTVATWNHLDVRYDKNGDGRPESATWAWGFEEGQPAEEMARRANRFWPNLPSQPGSTPVPAGTTVPLRIYRNFVSVHLANRPGIVVNPDGTTRPGKLLQAPFVINWHETANLADSADAEMHRQFVENGGGKEGVSFHFAVDHNSAVQILPLNEQGKHIGTAEGNRRCVGIETCVNLDGAYWQQTKENLAQLTAAILLGDERIDYGGLKPSDFSADRITIHGDWGTGTSCPARIRQEGTRNAILARTRALVGGVQPGPTPIPVPPPPTGIVYPKYLDKGLMERRFGQVTGEDGKVYRYSEAATARVSAVWRQEYGPWGWPPLRTVWVYEAGKRRFFDFDGGPMLFVGEDGNPVMIVANRA